jgi:uncharacterized RDD family membrane protein YckC
MTTAEPAEALAEHYPALPYAGISLRIVAAVLDLIVSASLLMLFVAAAGLILLLRTDWGAKSNITNADVLPSAIVLLSYFLFLPWYFIALWWWKGQSVGMMAVHIAVTTRDGGHLSLGQAFLRTIAWPLSLLPVGLGLTPMFFDDESRALHDMIAGTTVVELP